MIKFIDDNNIDDDIYNNITLNVFIATVSN